MALIPSTTYHHTERNSSPLFASKDISSQMTVYNGQDLASSSELNPNATDYTPKSGVL